MIIIVAMIVARLVWVYGSDLVILLCRRFNLTNKTPLGVKSATIVGWAGMRGVVTLAVALSLPDTMPGRDFMLFAAFAAIFATVLIQGSTLGMLIRWLNVQPTQGDAPMSLNQAEVAIAQAELHTVEKYAYGPDGTLIHPRILEQYQRRLASMEVFAENKERLTGDLEAHFNLVLMAIASGRAELMRLRRTNKIDDETLHALERDLDLEELSAISAKS